MERERKNPFLVSPLPRGFTLIETLVAVSILMGAVAGPLTIAQKSLTIARGARGQITAHYLAQDALEYVRSVRDGNFIGGSNWLSNLGPCKNKACYADTTLSADRITSCSGACPALRYDAATGLYGYDRGAATSIVREIRLDTFGSGREAEAVLTVRVLWQEAAGARELLVRENLYDWRRERGGGD